MWNNQNTEEALLSRIEDLEECLRYLASYVGNGGYNSTEVNPYVFVDKITDGITTLCKTANELGLKGQSIQ